MTESPFHTLFARANLDSLQGASCSIPIPYSQQELWIIEQEQHELFEAHFREQAMYERIMSSRQPAPAHALHLPAVELPTGEIQRPRPPSAAAAAAAAVSVSPTSTTSDDIFWEYQQAWDNHHHHKQKTTTGTPTTARPQPQRIVVELSDDDEGIFELEL